MLSSREVGGGRTEDGGAVLQGEEEDGVPVYGCRWCESNTCIERGVETTSSLGEPSRYLSPPDHCSWKPQEPSSNTDKQRVHHQPMNSKKLITTEY